MTSTKLSKPSHLTASCYDLKMTYNGQGLCAGWILCDSVACLAVTFFYHGQITEVD
jgi:hypothetical protein